MKNLANAIADNSGKLTEVTRGRAFPTHRELSAFRRRLTVDSVGELKAGPGCSDWKAGQGGCRTCILNEKYPYATAAARFFEAIKDEGPPALELGGGDQNSLI
jgi:hypothetical protein